MTASWVRIRKGLGLSAHTSIGTNNRLKEEISHRSVRIAWDPGRYFYSFWGKINAENPVYWYWVFGVFGIYLRPEIRSQVHISLYESDKG